MFSIISVALSAIISLGSFSNVAASPCVVFDADFNLLLLGYGGKDFSLGAQSSWASGPTATDITATGRPPFDGTNTTCYLSQFENSIYVINGDQATATNIGIYDAVAKSWTTQATSTGGGGGQSFSYADFVTILDHDTNVFYALSGGVLYFADFKQEKSANASAIPWTNVGTPPFSTTGYNPVMALANNHIQFLDVPGVQAGSAQIFVIHFSFFQPTAQAFQPNGSASAFPEAHGQTASLFQPLPAVQQEFSFIPDDGSSTYIVNVLSNTTATLAGPSDKSSSTYASSITALVQLTSAGNLFYLPYTQGDASTNSAAKWTKISASGLPAASSSSSSSASGGASGSGSGSAPPATGSGSATGSAPTTSATGGAEAFTLGLIRTIGIAGICVSLGMLVL